jgi:hypothetical protein
MRKIISYGNKMDDKLKYQKGVRHPPCFCRANSSCFVMLHKHESDLFLACSHGCKPFNLENLFRLGVFLLTFVGAWLNGKPAAIVPIATFRPFPSLFELMIITEVVPIAIVTIRAIPSYCGIRRSNITEI